VFFEEVRVWMARFDAEERRARGETVPPDVELYLKSLVASAVVRSASWRTSTRPACDTTPVPPPVTSRPRDHAGAFTWKVLLELD
jgi:hypothetical protein